MTKARRGRSLAGILYHLCTALVLDQVYMDLVDNYWVQDHTHFVAGYTESGNRRGSWMEA